MAIISFWNNGKEETGKSSAIAAISTYMGINHNYKVLIVNTRHNDYFYQDCYWRESKSEKRVKSSITSMGDGINGLSRAVLSNKITPEIITNYTKIVFNDNRLEILMDTDVQDEEYKTYKKVFKDIIQMANKFYDLIFVDIDSNLDDATKESIMQASDLIVGCVAQRIRNINAYLKEIKQNKLLQEKPLLTCVGRYDSNSKYTGKVIAKYIKAKQVAVIPYNTAFMEACNEGKVSDYFIKYRNVGKKDKNAPFVVSVSETAQKIIYKLQELQMKI